MAYSLQQFVAETRDQRPATGAAFEVEKDCFLQVNLGTPGGTGGILNQVWIKTGSMVAYQGEVKFEREGMMDHGFSNMLKKQFTGEGATLTKASSKGRAQLYLADNSKRVTILFLQGESVVVNGDDLLAFEPTVTHKITMMKKLSSIVSGGLYNVTLKGQGFVAILTHGKPLTLMVAPGFPPVFTDPQATVAWSGDLTPDFKSDVGLKTLLGRSSGETFQMKFDASKGQGFVVVQPHEEFSEVSSSSS
ncbi:hypothetical protein M758_3G050200 [Ceratodon purpureus]|uniref:AIM24 family protein n=1 Tax=Ceratodon purpureus TaxID=3225 RepID=A0A8T0IHH5_CERPU|nr:hypothetical protein KC19_3G047300 [Ceratodon purpureus]KAG0621808.1 hypothetical protein M758_3G050200 [Ceratodon purpureus]